MDDGTKNFRCTVDGCTGAFGSEAGLKAHTLRHTSSFPCPRCDKKFNAKSDLERHVAAIHEHQHFQCEEPGCRRADKPFSRLDSLQRHLHKVHGKRPGSIVPSPASAPVLARSPEPLRPAKRRLAMAGSDPGTPETAAAAAAVAAGPPNPSHAASSRERLLAQRVDRLEANLAEMRERHAEELRSVRDLHAKEMSEQRAMSRDLMDIIKNMSRDKA